MLSSSFVFISFSFQRNFNFFAAGLLLFIYLFGEDKNKIMLNVRWLQPSLTASAHHLDRDCPHKFL